MEAFKDYINLAVRKLRLWKVCIDSRKLTVLQLRKYNKKAISNIYMSGVEKC